VKPSDPLRRLHAVAAWCELRLDSTQVMNLERYAAWLADEALVAGGIGPGEASRIWDRHVLDSLTFLFPLATLTEGTVADLGSGVGLPGLVMAIARPELTFALWDRSQRRVELVQRALRMLRLENVTAEMGDINRLDGEWEAVTMRAVLPATTAVDVVRSLLAPGGVGVIGGSRSTKEVDPTIRGLVPDVEIVQVPPDILDSPAWLLMIRPRDH
jgi:16S rRNA (guanine527-N7)-methyltransferase